MTTSKELARKLGVDYGHVTTAISVLRTAGVFPGEDLMKKITFTRSDGIEQTRMVRDLSPVQEAAVEGALLRMGANPRARNPKLIALAESRGRRS